MWNYIISDWEICETIFLVFLLKNKHIIYTTQELRKANNKPIIRHLWGTTKEGLYLTDKPWLFNQDCKIKKEWEYYARKTGYYDSICKFFKKAC